MKRFTAILATVLLSGMAAFAQVPGPQIPLTGSIGVPGSSAVLGYFPVSFTSDANHTLTPTEWANHVLLVTSTVSLTATRNLIAPNNFGQDMIVQNKTTGGQSIQVISSSGTGVTIPNGQSAEVFFDGTNYAANSSGAGISGSGTTGTVPIWTGSTALGDSPIDLGVTLANNLTIQPPNNDSIQVLSTGAGTTTITAGSGIDINSSTGNVRLESVASGGTVQVVTDGNAQNMSFPSPGFVGTVGVLEGSTTATHCINVASDGVGIQDSGTPCTPPAGSNIGDRLVWNGTSYVPRYPQINSATNIIDIGDSNCNPGLGNTVRSRSFCNVINNTIGSTVVKNEGISGATVADMFIGTLYGNTNDVNTQPCFSSNLWVESFGTNNASRQTTAPAVQTAYLQESMGVVVATGLCSPAFIVPQTTGVTVTGTSSIQTFRNATQWLNLTSAGATVSFSITTDGYPIYLMTMANETDTGTQSATIDGASSPAVDSITNTSVLANTLFGGTDINNSFFSTQTPMLQRYPVAAGTHTVTFTCITPGTNGCGFFNASTKTVGSLPAPYIEPTVLLYGVIPQESNGEAANTAAFNALNQQTATVLQGDGLNVYFGDIYNTFENNLSTFLGATDQATATGTTLTDASITAGSFVVTSPSHTFGVKDIGKDIYIEGAGAAGATLYATIVPGSVSFGNTATLSVAATMPVTSATAFVGWLGQICPASQNPGLHMTDCGSLYMAKTGLSLVQAVSAPPPLSLNLNAGQAYNINGLNVASVLTTGLPNPSLLVANLTAGPYGMRLGGNGTNSFLDLFVPNSNSNGVRLCNGATLTSASLNCTFISGRIQNTSTVPINLAGEQVNSIVATTGNVYGSPITAPLQTVINNATTSSLSDLLLPAGGLESAIQTISGVGMTPGNYTVNASSGAAQALFVVMNATTVVISRITMTGAGYSTSSPPTFTIPTGTTQPVFAGAVVSPAGGQRYTFKRSDSSANTVIVDSGAGTLNGVTGGTVSLTQNQAVTVWYDATTGWHTESLYQANSAPTGLSGMTVSQVPIAATATTVTSSKAIAGAGAGLTSGPTTATATDVPVFTSTTGGLVDSGISVSSLCQTSGTNCPASSSYSLGGTLSNSNVVVGAGAGTGATASLTGQDGNHLLQITTGLAPNNTALYATVNFTASRGRVTFCTLYPASQSSISLVGTSTLFLSSSATTQYLASIVGLPLAASTLYEWNVSCP